MAYCPRCSNLIGRGEIRGESQIYKSHDVWELCEPCFIDEDDEIEERGTNDLPNTLERYRKNMRALR